MKANEIRQKYLNFFEKKRHEIIASASLIPENDSSTLFTSSGMQPLVPYLLGEKHPAGLRLTDSQKCFRSEDIEEVGDGRHNTFFEMLGNWSLGDYFKSDELNWLFEFLIKEIKLDPLKIYVTVFRGNSEMGITRDSDSVNIWKELFKKYNIEAKDVDFSEDFGLQNGRIFYYDEKKNWWSRSGVPINMPIGEIGGGDSEIFYDLGENLKLHENSLWKDKPCHVNCDCGRFIEIGNSVFIEYKKTFDGFEELFQKNVDFGGGLERITMVSQNKISVFETDLFESIISKISKLSGGKIYAENRTAFEIIADHLKSATFILGDDYGIVPANTDQGYIVRRLIRRAIRYGKKINIEKNNWTVDIVKDIVEMYSDTYKELDRNKEFIFNNLCKEEEKFKKTLEKGIEIIEKMRATYQGDSKEFSIDVNNLFDLYQTYGFPIELSLEEINRIRIEMRGRAMSRDIELNLLNLFNEELKKHQELSRTASAGKFKGGLADSSEETIKLHTAAHLLLAALRMVLGDGVYQKGSNITAERLRYDFSYSEKMTTEQIKEVEKLVNEAISKKMAVRCEEISLEEARNIGAIGVFDSKYSEKVKVYTVGDFSKEICGGPHVGNTGELGHFAIIKEESSGSGVRRIKAILNDYEK